MRKPHRLGVAAMCMLAAASTSVIGQEREEPENFNRDVLRSLFGSNWNVFAHAGATTNGQFLLQRPLVGGEVALRSQGGFNVGVGAGVDFILRQGLRMSYTHAKNDLEYRTDNGTGSAVLDADANASLTTHVATIEIIRYMLPARSSFTPYASAGIVGSWWAHDGGGTSPIQPAGGSTQFRTGVLASFGFQVKLADHFSSRLELVSASLGNPFSGRSSMVSNAGTTIDEPTRVNKTDYRLVAVYHFAKPNWPPPRRADARVGGGERRRRGRSR